MPTLRGWLVGGTAVALLLVGRLFGAGAVEQLGFALLALVFVAVGVVRLGRHDLKVKRRVTPGRVAASQPVTSEIRITNEGKGSAPLLLLEDRLPPALSGSARLALHGVEPGGTRSTSVTLRPARRGSYEVGPLQISFVDPFGLARVRWRALGTSSFLVHPSVEPLSPPRDQGERRSPASAARRQPTGVQGEDFYTLREYVEGDDLRRIHWASTAKRNRYMIRQEETPWHTRATIVLDDRAGAHEGFGHTSSFGRAVEAAASLADLYHRSGYSWRLAGACHPGLPPGKGVEHLNRCLDLLATLQTSRQDEASLLRTLSDIEASGGVEAALVLVTGSLDSEMAVALTRCRRRFRQVTAVSFPKHRFSGHGTKARWEGEARTVEVARLLSRSSIRVVIAGPDDPLASAWNATTQPRNEGEGQWGRKPELV
jgi:uncharacterized protein (DUF58 family)